jgi:predicted O-linked N-acetylglucosamine transferase (SPINDLY family)
MVSGDQFDTLCKAGNAHFAAGRFEQAVIAYQDALRLRQDFAPVHANLGHLFLSMGRVDEALASCQKALALQPDLAQAQNNLGNVLQILRKLDEAIVAYTRALEIQPNFMQAAYNLANTLSMGGNFDAAEAAYRKALSIQPDLEEANNNLAVLLKDMGRIEEAIELFDRALERRPSQNLYSSRLYSIYFHPNYPQQKIYEDHVRWNDRYARALGENIAPHENDRSPDRRLRIGYVSPDFRNHCQSLFTIPLLSHHDHKNFEIYCYANVPRPDALTQKIRDCADVWRSTVGVSDEQLCETIRKDQIDILVDLTLHMSSGRPLLFARKPAPIQISFLAYPGTTGLKTVDYRFTDPNLDPPSLNDAFYTEQCVRLPRTVWCYDPLTDQPPVNDLPAIKSGHVTFGCLNNFAKVHDGVLDVWRQILAAVGDSRLILLAPEGSCRRKVLQKLNVDERRIQFVGFQPRAEYLKTYLQIDLGLDTFPVNGHTTSLDSLWMGVPVVSLYGQSAISRAGLSQTTNLGLAADFAAKTPEEFIQLAVKWANDLPNLSQLRATLRDRMAKSRLINAPQFSRDIETAYRQMWRKYWGDKSSQK